MIWEEAVPDEGENIMIDIGCSNAVAREAAPSSATDDVDINIVQRMPPGAVNLVKVASAMGRGPIQTNGDESAQRLEDDGDINRVTNTLDQHGKTSDPHRLSDCRGNQQPDDAQGTRQLQRCAGNR